ncbi:RNA helicase [Trypanosoma rangeli]|uniref:RNA helicase n=1 Tax=Trypanosoma rangeli TaxID=5698 RepID=A0A422NQC7_TRYRA|nr:RNA helicase [Trypanosoma rangeli]RNF07641.1 RNA helicase [Trypanosoma rangeli]|eukprot:RNF07641.1 RNA helicase [Trypanosoma rangeli]
MAQRVTIPDDCVYEGYGSLYRGEAEVSPPLPTLEEHDDGGVLYGSFEHEDALRQLRTALRVDVPPQLRALTPEEGVDKLVSSPAKPCRLVCPPDALPLGPLPFSSSSGTRYEIDRMKSQCHFLRDWLMCHETPEERVAAREFARTMQRLLQKECVEELLGRTDSLLQQLEDWPGVVDKICSRAVEWDKDTSLRELHDFVRDLFETDDICARLAKLTRRFSLLAPLLEEAAFRAAALEEIQQWSSESTVTSLQTLRASIEGWGTRVAEDQQSMLDSFQSLLERILAVKHKRVRNELT